MQHINQHFFIRYSQLQIRTLQTANSVLHTGNFDIYHKSDPYLFPNAWADITVSQDNRF